MVCTKIRMQNLPKWQRQKYQLLSCQFILKQLWTFCLCEVLTRHNRHVEFVFLIQIQMNNIKWRVSVMWFVRKHTPSQLFGWCLQDGCDVFLPNFIVCYFSSATFVTWIQSKVQDGIVWNVQRQSQRTSVINAWACKCYSIRGGDGGGGLCIVSLCERSCSIVFIIIIVLLYCIQLSLYTIKIFFSIYIYIYIQILSYS